MDMCLIWLIGALVLMDRVSSQNYNNVNKFQRRTYSLGYGFQFSYVAYIKAKTPENVVRECGGAILSDSYAITSAQCIVDVVPSSISVSVQPINSAATTTTVGKVIIHEKFNRYSLKNDIALLRFASRLPLNDSTGVASVTRNAIINSLDTQTVRVVGFGTGTGAAVPPRGGGGGGGGEGGEGGDDGGAGGVEGGEAGETGEMNQQSEKQVQDPSTGGRGAAKSLYYSDVTQINMESCNSKVSDLFKGYPDTMSCIQAAGTNKGACLGDKGSLVLYKPKVGFVYLLVGIVSEFGRCGSSYPTAYTRVAPYMPWIASFLKEDLVEVPFPGSGYYQDPYMRADFPSADY